MKTTVCAVGHGSLVTLWHTALGQRWLQSHRPMGRPDGGKGRRWRVHMSTARAAGKSSHGCVTVPSATAGMNTVSCRHRCPEARICILMCRTNDLPQHPPPPDLPLQDDGSGGGPRELHFSRVIVPSSSDPSLPPSTLTYSSEYRVDGRLVGWAAYAARLGQLGILVKVRNFLVFQVGRGKGHRGTWVGCHY